MTDRLGPLERRGASWVIGDPAGDHLNLERDGITHCIQGGSAPLIPWSLFTNLRVYAVATKLGNSKGVATFSRITMNLSGASASGGGPARVMATLTDRGYWEAEFRHHARWYPPREIRILSAFLDQLVERGEAARLGDPEWLSTVVRELGRLPRSMPRTRNAAIIQILDAR